MSKKKIPTRSDPGGDGSPSRRLSDQTSLRRSPRFHPQKNDDPNSEKNPEEEPHLQSPPISPDCKRTRQAHAAGTGGASQSRRRSPRLASNSAEVTGKDVDCSQRLRRSPRFATNSVEVTRKEDNLDIERRRSTSVGVDGSEDERGDGEKGRGEKKRRKREENVEVEMETGRNEVEECCGFEGWTRKQEAALRRAYFSARPSPHFWKKVSKMVPGKSAQECFNRIHADPATPTQPRPRSRANRLNFSPVGILTSSDSKSTEPMKTKVKRVRSSKQKILVAHKTMRHLIRKHCLIDRSQEADHFSNLETSPNLLPLELPEINSPEAPDCAMNPSIFLQKCSERSSSAHKKMLSGFNKSQADPSPEVLKKIKNIALHEKYIDQLHCRDARRRTCAKTANSDADPCNKTNTGLQIGALKTARSALISEARDRISHFQQMQANLLDNRESFDTDDDNADTDDFVDDCDE